MGAGFDPARRALLRGRTRPSPALRPPWVNAARLERCERCGACARACPEHIIVTGDGRFPEVDFGRGGCSFCRACALACPVDGLFDLAAEPWAQIAALSDACLARRGVHCQSCTDWCDARAIRFALAPRRPPQPVVQAELCTGCGACVAACPTSAIGVGHG